MEDERRTVGSGSPPSKHAADVGGMFDRIAQRYDFLNHLLSMRRDIAWRRRLAAIAAQGTPSVVIDVATGTADQAIAIARLQPDARVTGVDISLNMLEVGQRKIQADDLQDRICLAHGDALHLPAVSSTVDVAHITFGIRNVEQVDVALKEMYRALKPGGKILIMEFGLPQNGFLRFFYLIYLRHILPIIGGLLSGDSTAYRYLNRTVEAFPYARDFADLLETAGFHECTFTPLTFGVAYLYEARKPA